MRILHTSDLHGDLFKLEHIIQKARDFDLWVDTGDFLPNDYIPYNPTEFEDRLRTGPVPGYEKWFEVLKNGIRHTRKRDGSYEYPDFVGDLFQIERDFQTKWIHLQKARILSFLRGRSALFLRGNHDYIAIGDILGHPQLWPEPFMFRGLTFAGYPHVPTINGYQSLETHDRRPHIEEAWSHNPMILCTHAPPSGILSKEFGCNQLSTKLFYDPPSNLRTHLFGHVHFMNDTMEEAGIFFSNAATYGRVLCVDDSSGKVEKVFEID